jgi:chemotaxis protein MotB
LAVKQKCPEFENHERWLVSYADMVTLLFAVFVVLYALQIAGQKKNQQQVAGSMQESFNTPLQDIPQDRRIGPHEAGLGIFEHFKGDSIRPSIVQKYPSASQRLKVIDDEMNQIKVKLEDRLYGPNKFREKTKAGQERLVTVHRTTKGFKLQLLARHFFDAGSVNVNRGALKELSEVAGILKDLGRPITIEGHTDSVPPSGQFGNWEISTLRATNVLKYLVRQHNFPTSQISAAGYADTRPIAHNGSESGRMLNRRIEIHVDYSAETAPEPAPQ